VEGNVEGNVVIERQQFSLSRNKCIINDSSFAVASQSPVSAKNIISRITEIEEHELYKKNLNS
jgi:hypothetical protein